MPKLILTPQKEENQKPKIILTPKGNPNLIISPTPVVPLREVPYTA